MIRVLDFGNPNPFADIFGGPLRLAWPVDVYRVTVPLPPARDDGLNPFERVVLGVLQADPGLTTEDVAVTTCIPSDLLRSVVARLRDRELIDRDNRPSREGHSSRTVGGDDSRYVTAMVFQDAVGGRLLPYIHILDERSTLKKREREEYEVTEIRVGRESHRHPPPEPKSVLGVLHKTHTRRSSRETPPQQALAAQIRVGPKPERHLLECPIAIQRSDAEFRIADPFGDSYSLVLEESFSRLLDSHQGLQKWMTRWRNSLAQAESSNGSDSRSRQPYEDVSIRRLFPRLVESLRPDPALGVRSTPRIYASLEWALFYCADARNARDAVEILKQTSARELPGVLALAAEKAGLSAPKSGFRAVLPGRLQDFLDGKAEMGTVTAITLMQAVNDTSHPVRRVAEAHPDFLERIQELKDIRDARSHGEMITATTGESRFDPFLRECVSLLLPTVGFSGSQVARSASSIDDSRLQARTAIIDALGYKLVNQLSGAALDALLEAERHWGVHNDGGDTLSLIVSLNASVQAVMRVKLSGARGAGVSESDYLATATERARAAGLGELPQAFAGVRSERIREATQGNDSSLGASVVGYLLTTSPEQLQSLGIRQPELLRDIGDVLALRGHGNQAVPMSRSEAGQLRRKTLNSIRTLMEA